METVLEYARAKAVRSNQTVRTWLEGPPRFDTDEPRGTLDRVLLMMADEWVAYPTGLVIPVSRVNWFWWFPDGPRLGTADQAAKYAEKRGVYFSDVIPYPPVCVHGTCVHECDPDGRNLRLIQARSFPAWTGV